MPSVEFLERPLHLKLLEALKLKGSFRTFGILMYTYSWYSRYIADYKFFNLAEKAENRP